MSTYGLVKHVRLVFPDVKFVNAIMQGPRNQHMKSVSISVSKWRFPLHSFAQLTHLVLLDLQRLDVENFVEQGMPFITEMTQLKYLLLPLLSWPLAGAYKPGYFSCPKHIFTSQAALSLRKLPRLQFLHVQLESADVAEEAGSLELIQSLPNVSELSITCLPICCLKVFKVKNQNQNENQNKNQNENQNESETKIEINSGIKMPRSFGALKFLSLGVFNGRGDEFLALSSLRSLERLFLWFPIHFFTTVCAAYNGLFSNVLQLVRNMKWLEELHIDVPRIPHHPHQAVCSCFAGGPLFLEHQNLTSLTLKGFKSFPSSLIHLDRATRLQYLCLNNDTILCEEFLNSIPSGLVSLDLEHARVSVGDFLNAAGKWTQLMRLNVTHCNFESKKEKQTEKEQETRLNFFARLLDVLAKNKCRIRALNLSGFYCVDDDVLSKLIVEFPLIEQLGIRDTLITNRKMACLLNLSHLRILDYSPSDSLNHLRLHRYASPCSNWNSVMFQSKTV